MDVIYLLMLCYHTSTAAISHILCRFCGSAPWDPRAWHSAVVMDRLLYVLGGTPLNNEVWTLDISSIQKISRPRAPLTRAFYLPYTYTMTWMQQLNAPWSPRCGMGAITQFYFNESIQTVDEGAPRIVLMGGYGGWLEQTSSSASSSSQGVYDGIRCREDVWAMAQTGVWYLLNSSAAFGPRAWFGFASLVSPYDPRLDIASISPGRNNSYPARMFAVGGGNIGFSTSSSAVISSMDGMVDVYFSIDGITWTRVNYQEGGGSSLLALYSSEVWAKLTIAREITYVGLWGMTLTSFDFSNASQVP